VRTGSRATDEEALLSSCTVVLRPSSFCPVKRWR
jgi:hypothetical protein